MKSHNLLVVGCSRQKRPDAGLMPAIDRYDGPVIRVLRKFLRVSSTQSNLLDTYVLSAQFGLISTSTPIPSYDRRMTAQRAQELSPCVLSALAQLFESRSYREAYLCVGREYLSCLSDYETVVPEYTKVHVAEGTLGERQYRLRQWLYKEQEPVDEPMKQSDLVTGTGPVRLRGIEVTLTADDAIAKGRLALQGSREWPHNFRTWYVDIDGNRVAPKWLASQITGLSVGGFGSSEARRFLDQLGVEVRSI